jgi:hypothetical protein
MSEAAPAPKGRAGACLGACLAMVLLDVIVVLAVVLVLRALGVLH